MTEADDKILGHLDAFSARAMQALFAARLKAGQRGASAMEVADLLLGLIMEDQGTIGGLLPDTHGRKEFIPLPIPSHSPFFSSEAAGMLLAKIEAQILPAAPIPHTKDVPLSPELERTFDRARDVQNMFHHEQIGPLHLLAAVLAEESSQQTKLLQDVGITKEHVFRTLKAMKLVDQMKMKQVSRELARAINEALAESQSVVEVVSKARTAGLGVSLRLDATVTLKRLGLQENTVPDRRILESLHMRLDVDESGSMQHWTERPNWSFGSYIRWHSLRQTENTVLFRFK